MRDTLYPPPEPTRGSHRAASTEDALIWARSVLADLAHHRDPTVITAAKTIADQSDDAEEQEKAAALLALLDGYDA